VEYNHAQTPPPDPGVTKPPDPERVVYLWDTCNVAFIRPLQGRMERVLGLPWAASACDGLAHGYSRSAFQAA